MDRKSIGIVYPVSETPRDDSGGPVGFTHLLPHALLKCGPEGGRSLYLLHVEGLYVSIIDARGNVTVDSISRAQPNHSAPARHSLATRTVVEGVKKWVRRTPRLLSIIRVARVRLRALQEKITAPRKEWAMKNQSHALKRLLENLHERHSLLLVHGNHVETSHLMLPLVRDIDWIRLIHTEHSKGGLDREVVQAYGPEFANDWFVRKLRRQYEELLQQAARFTFPSYGAMSLFEEHKHSIPLNTCARVSVIYSGVDVAPLPIPPPKHGEMQASLFAIAKHVPEKGIDRMIRAIRTLKSEQINVSLRIAGAYTSLSSELYRLREDCALNPRDIEFLGPLSSARILEELSRADLFLACPHVVVFDLSLLEAMAAGKAIVTTRLAGNVEALGEHYEGLFDSDDELPSVIARLLREEPLRAQMGIANRKRYEEEFTLSRMATRYIQLYESVAEESIVPSMRCKP